MDKEPLLHREMEDPGNMNVNRTQIPIPRTYEDVVPINIDKSLNFSEVVIPSTLKHHSAEKQAENVVREFNVGVETIMAPSVMFGTRILRDEFRLVHRNNTPELVPYSSVPMRKLVFPTGVTEELGVFKQTDLQFGAHGR